MSQGAGNSQAAQRQPGLVTVRRLAAHEWPAYRQLRLRSLAEAPYAFGSTFAAEEAWRPEIWMARLSAAAVSGRDCPLVAESLAEAEAKAARAAGDEADPDGGTEDAHVAAQAAAPDADRPMLGLVYAKCDADEAGVVNLFQMWVAPEARGGGVAAALLRHAIDWARSIGAHAVRLGVVDGNPAAARLYARAGFRDIGAPFPVRPGAAALEQTMQLEIAAAPRDAAPEAARCADAVHDNATHDGPA